MVHFLTKMTPLSICWQRAWLGCFFQACVFPRAALPPWQVYLLSKTFFTKWTVFPFQHFFGVFRMLNFAPICSRYLVQWPCLTSVHGVHHLLSDAYDYVLFDSSFLVTFILETESPCIFEFKDKRRCVHIQTTITISWQCSPELMQIWHPTSHSKGVTNGREVWELGLTHTIQPIHPLTKSYHNWTRLLPPTSWW